MTPRLHTIPDLVEGHILERPNRFVLTVDLDNGGPTEVSLSNTGGHNLVESGRQVLVRPVSDSNRRTAYDAVFIEVGGVWVTADAGFANNAFEKALSGGYLEGFDGYTVRRAEPPFNDAVGACFQPTVIRMTPTDSSGISV